VLSYFRTVRMSLFDSVPKAIMYSLVNPTKKLMEKELMVRVYDESLLGLRGARHRRNRDCLCVLASCCDFSGYKRIGLRG